MPPIHPVIAQPEDQGERLDSFLSRRLAPEIAGLSRSRVKSLIEQGLAQGDGRTITEPSHRVKPGTTYLLTLPDAAPAEPVAQEIPLAVLFEDAHLIVIDKPAGLVVHPAPGNPDHTLVNALLNHCGDSLAGIGGVRRPGIVHRLDKDTSGVMVVAKTDQAHQALTAAFSARDIDRAYVAVCWGLPSPLTGEIVGSIGRDPKNRKRMAVVSRNGREAITRYRVEKAFGTAAAAVECRLLTGRTHQIRVHMTHAGHPLIGDPVYGRATAGRLKALPPPGREAALNFHRQALHARLLGFAHPATGEALSFETAPPADLQVLLRQLGASQPA